MWVRWDPPHRWGSGQGPSLKRCGVGRVLRAVDGSRPTCRWRPRRRWSSRCTRSRWRTPVPGGRAQRCPRLPGLSPAIEQQPLKHGAEPQFDGCLAQPQHAAFWLTHVGDHLVGQASSYPASGAIPRRRSPGPSTSPTARICPPGLVRSSSPGLAALLAVSE